MPSLQEITRAKMLHEYYYFDKNSSHNLTEYEKAFKLIYNRTELIYFL
jgi:hypothetical protein